MAVRIAKSLTIWDVPQVRTALREAACAAQAVELDLSAGETIDVAGLQLVCSAHRALERDGGAFTLVGSRAVRSAARQAGFQRRTGCTPTCVWTERGDG